MFDFRGNSYADLGIEPAGSLAETAAILGSILALSFAADDKGQFDEFPSYVAEKNGVRVALLGVPEPDQDFREFKSDEFTLMVQPVRSLKDAPRTEVSSELLAVLLRDGRLKAWLLT